MKQRDGSRFLILFVLVSLSLLSVTFWHRSGVNNPYHSDAVIASSEPRDAFKGRCLIGVQVKGAHRAECLTDPNVRHIY